MRLLDGREDPHIASEPLLAMFAALLKALRERPRRHGRRHSPGYRKRFRLGRRTPAACCWRRNRRHRLRRHTLPFQLPLSAWLQAWPLAKIAQHVTDATTQTSEPAFSGVDVARVVASVVRSINPVTRRYGHCAATRDAGTQTPGTLY